MRHVGEELGLVLGGQGELLRLLLQLLVGLLQLLCKRLRLLEQVLRARVGLDGVDDDADRLRQLVEKANLLSWQNKQVEAKNQEVERAKKLLEEKAEQLALISKLRDF